MVDEDGVGGKADKKKAGGGQDSDIGRSHVVTYPGHTESIGAYGTIFSEKDLD